MKSNFVPTFSTLFQAPKKMGLGYSNPDDNKFNVSDSISCAFISN